MDDEDPIYSNLDPIFKDRQSALDAFHDAVVDLDMQPAQQKRLLELAKQKPDDYLIRTNTVVLLNLMIDEERIPLPGIEKMKPRPVKKVEKPDNEEPEPNIASDMDHDLYGNYDTSRPKK